jgi:hypothetical protein
MELSFVSVYQLAGRPLHVGPVNTILVFPSVICCLVLKTYASILGALPG